jgi:hypothetical protein
MLDECMTLRASHLLINALEIHKPPIKAEFLEEHFKVDGTAIGKGALDPDWAKVLADEGDWCVITCDSKKPKGERAKLKGPPLHLILPARKITGFFLTGSMASASGFEKFRAVICVMPQLLERTNPQIFPAGTRFKISATNGRTAYEISEWPVKETLPTFPSESLPPFSLSPPAS